jgi:glycosyltransferase involved in cell wall biosynthesis/SAM-dependent methyltransferase
MSMGEQLDGTKHEADGGVYDRQYFETSLGPIPYDRTHPEWLTFFGAIAEHIATDIKPHRVLDVGCAKGFLVEALRDRGVDAFGIDISEYALSEVRPDIRRFCRLASAWEPLDGKYDLVVCIEVLEHLTEIRGRQAIANICRGTSDVLFSSTPDDFAEPTHINVRAQSWWIALFRENGFQLDLDYDAGFVSAQAMRFRRIPPPGTTLDAALAQRYELFRTLHGLRAEAQTREEAITGLRSAVAQLEARGSRLQSDLAAVQRGAEALRRELSARRLDITSLQATQSGLRSDLDAKDQTIARLSAQLDELRDSGRVKERLIGELEARALTLHHSGVAKDNLIAALNYDLAALQRTVGWKILERARGLRDRALPPNSRRHVAYGWIRQGTHVLLDEGPLALPQRAVRALALKLTATAQTVLPTTQQPPPTLDHVIEGPPQGQPSDPDLAYRRWIERHQPGAGDIAEMKAAARTLAYKPVISIVTPVYETDEKWLRKAIESVRAQIYPFWELCLVNDGSTKPHIADVLDEYSGRDPRVRVEHLPQNCGIVGASNRALELATGEFVALLDHDDELPREALFEVASALNETPDIDLIYTDEDKLELDGRRVDPFFKPDWSPDLLLSMNYITHLSVFRRTLLIDIGGFRPGFDGSQDYDLLLRFTERTGRIAHIAKILYHWRKIPSSVAGSPTAKPFAYEAARRAIEEATRRRATEARVERRLLGSYTVRYKIDGAPLVSIVVSSEDRAQAERLLRSIEEKTDYPNYEIVVVDCGGAELEPSEKRGAGANEWRVCQCPGPATSSTLSNLGAQHARGEYFLFLGGAAQVIEPDWITAMLEHAQRSEVGAVGARVHYPDGTIQHAGVTLGVGGVAAHAFRGVPHQLSYHVLADVVRNVSAVAADGMMVSRSVFYRVGGFDERLQALNDVDLCLRLRQRGYLVIYTPLALLHQDRPSTADAQQPPSDEEIVRAAWGEVIDRGDPYYNPNLTRSRTDWSLGD